ncbi:MAG: ABC transporter substrate-binding protein [Anaerolineales bacterium]|nr:ABC transporter substrate-binding protein [Anaerolineales bacterium]
MLKRSENIVLGMLFLALLLASCSSQDGATSVAAPPATIAPAPVLTASPTPQPQRELTICLAQEPNTLYPYGDPNRAAKSVLAAIYDGPYDSLSYAYQPVILQKMPSYQDGDVTFEPVLVSPGDEVVDIHGKLTPLEVGVQVFKSGCQTGADCVVTYAGNEPFMLDEMVVTFSLLPDLRWADGNPITADDSVFAYDLAVASDLASKQYLLARTDAYEAVDPLTVVWRGKPGYRDDSYMTDFFAPMPYHAWSVFSPRDLLETDVSSRFPLGWGAYVVDEWLPGELIRLVKNPIYFRAGEGLPKMDALKFVFTDNPDAALAALVNGECDLLDPAIPLDTQIALLTEMQSRDELQLFTVPSTSLEQLVFGIRPSSYDDGIVSGNDRPDFFGDPKMRQAVATCLDREQVITSVLHGYGVVPSTYLSPAHPFYAPDLPAYPFDPEAGATMLSALGWKDADNDPTTPRIAYRAGNVADGTRLVLRYMTTSGIQRRQSSEILTASLRACGIGVETVYLSLDEFYALGPQGALFGRNFDLAQLALGTDNFQPPCEWYSTPELPDSDNDWLAANLSGYSNAAFDSACARAKLSPRDPNAYLATQTIFAEDLPTVPLYAHLNIAVARADLCGFSLDPTADSALWNVEEFDLGECSP